MKQTIRKVVVGFFATLFAGGVFTFAYLDEQFCRTAPRQPEPRSGHVYPQIVCHGAQVYLTRAQAWPFQHFWLLFVPFAIGAILQTRWKPFRSYADMPKKFY